MPRTYEQDYAGLKSSAPVTKYVAPMLLDTVMRKNGGVRTNSCALLGKAQARRTEYTVVPILSLSPVRVRSC